MIRAVAALAAGVTATIAAAGAAVGLRRRRRTARRAERRRTRQAASGPRVAASVPSKAAAPAAGPARSAGKPAKVGTAGMPGKPGSAGKPVPEAGAALLQEGPTGLTLRSIKGIGDVVEGRLREVGVTSVEEVAAWTDADVERVASSARVSAERIRREDWIGQARSLVSPT